ncbi:hypothetical protein, partial [Streptomyces sp. KR55]|uniref:hypothetical protein n=1 Tax=Streptomyces sp. KR55 TaxID=3457425 RepID=UPI003FD63CF6
QAPAGPTVSYQAPAAQSAPAQAPAAPAASYQAPAAQSAPSPAPAAPSRDLASTDLSGGLTTRVPLDVSGHNSLIPTAREAAAAVNEVKPVHGNLWL